MGPASDLRVERRLLLYGFAARDAALTVEILGQAGLDSATCSDFESLGRELQVGAGALLVADEAVGNQRSDLLAQIEFRQPPWSDLPILLFSHHGTEAASLARDVERFGNVTVIERPTRVAVLVGMAKSALRARARQYQIRSYLAERQRSEQALLEADRRKDEFLAVLAHELRNPLAPLRSCLQVLRLAGSAEPGVASMHGMMERQVDHLVRLVDDLVDLSLVTRGKVELRKERVDLAPVLGTAIEAARPTMEAGRHEFFLDLPADPIVLEADPVRLAQIVTNLLNNSAKYTRDGGRIWLTARVVPAPGGPGELSLSVRDTGMGIAADALPHVFEMFTRSLGVADRGRGGLGIGLTLVRRLVELHGGWVEAHSEGAGKGSEFVVRLPLAVAADGSRGRPAGRTDGKRSSLPRGGVLVVDDNQDAARSLSMVLELLGVPVEVAGDGVAALEALAARKPDAVLLDIGMPGLDGYEVARRIRQRPELRDVALIALTGWGQEEDRQRSRAAGFDHHLVKPVDADVLQDLLASLRSSISKRT